MVLKASSVGGVQIYQVAGGENSLALPEWLVRKNRQSLRYDDEYRSRVELLQLFEFPEASNKIKSTRDGAFAVATGTYKPQIRVWDLTQSTLKFERHTNTENVDFEILSDDWTKSIHLQNDRSVELHSIGGIHHSVRIPKFGRSIKYHYPSCDAFIGSSGDEIYRLNLDQGRFLSPFTIGQTRGGGQNARSDTINVLDVNPAHQLLACGTTEGFVEFFDPRTRDHVALLQLERSSGMIGASTLSPLVASENSLAVTALASRHDGLNLAVGTDAGYTFLYDLRAPKAWSTKDQGYGLPIKSLSWVYSASGQVPKNSSDAEDLGDHIGGRGLLMSSDAKVIKIWDMDTTKNFASVTPSADINDVHLLPETGMLFVAQESSSMSAYHIPQLGPAPKWCRFLDSITEEMEENVVPTVYEDYKFVDRKQLSELSLDHLMGTNVLKPYMHGFFIDLRLYNRAKAIAEPFAYEQYRDKKIREQIEKERDSRIRSSTKLDREAAALQQKSLPKVNRSLAERMIKNQEKQEILAQKKLARTGQTTMSEVSKTDKPVFPKVLQDERFKELFADPDYEVDEETREYALIHPSKVASARDDSEDEQSASIEGDSDNDRIQRVEPRARRRLMPVATSNISTAREADASFSRRVRQLQPTSRNRLKQSSVRQSGGGREMTFVPEKRKHENGAGAARVKPRMAARSASKNVMGRR